MSAKSVHVSIGSACCDLMDYFKSQVLVQTAICDVTWRPRKFAGHNISESLYNLDICISWRSLNRINSILPPKRPLASHVGIFVVPLVESLSKVRLYDFKQVTLTEIANIWYTRLVILLKTQSCLPRDHEHPMLVFLWLHL